VRKGYGQELPARVLQRCLLALFRHPLNLFTRRGVDELTGIVSGPKRRRVDATDGDAVAPQTTFLALDTAIKTTNRRVNALENVVKPKLENTIAYIKVPF
jgi:hypothetical protein